jgi:hypothetical protein
MGSRLLAVLKDYPLVATAGIGVAVLLHHGLYDVVHLLPDVPGRMGSYSDVASIYVGFAGVVAITAGFTGVVIVFALTSPSERFVRLRHRGGARLEANWISPIATAFAAAFGGVGCAVLAASGHGFAAWWLFEFFFAAAGLSSLRLLWIFRAMIKVTRRDDRESAERAEAPLSLRDMQERRRPPA